MKVKQTRKLLNLVSAIALSVMALSTYAKPFSSNQTEGSTMKPKAFIYTELQINIEFNDIPWQRVNADIKKQPGFLNKTWLHGYQAKSGGGLYAFDSIENAQKFVADYFPKEAAGFGVAQTTRIFDAEVTEEASLDMNSVHYGKTIDQEPGAFVYTEVQLHVLPFDNAPWRELNPVLKQQPGLLSKTWLSGLNGTPGGIYAFDTIENAQHFAIKYFPTEAKALNAAYTTRVFDAKASREASIAMDSPFYQ